MFLSETLESKITESRSVSSKEEKTTMWTILSKSMMKPMKIKSVSCERGFVQPFGTTMNHTVDRRSLRPLPSPVKQESGGLGKQAQEITVGRDDRGEGGGGLQILTRTDIRKCPRVQSCQNVRKFLRSTRWLPVTLCTFRTVGTAGRLRFCCSL